MDIYDIENERKLNFYFVNKSLYSSTKYIPSLNLFSAPNVFGFIDLQDEI